MIRSVENQPTVSVNHPGSLHPGYEASVLVHVSLPATNALGQRSTMPYCDKINITITI